MANGKSLNIKDSITIRFRKLADGRQSIYLDIYKKGVRNRVYLNKYLVPETSVTKIRENKKTLQMAEAIKSKLLEDITCLVSLSLNTSKSRMSFLDVIQVFLSYMTSKKLSKRRITSIKCALAHLTWYIEQEKLLSLRVGDIDQDFCIGFENYLKTAKDIRYKHPSARRIKKGVLPKTISEGTAFSYLAELNRLLTWGKKNGYLADNPIDSMTISLRKQTEEKNCLAVDDLKILAKTEIPDPETKRAFIFACLSGLWFIDILALTWDDITVIDGTYSIHVINKKTKKHSDLQITPAALIWLPERGDSLTTDKVFCLRKKSAIENHMHSWIQKAGLNKPVSFHIARYTYANFVAKGADLYAISLDLGIAADDLTEVFNKTLILKKRQASSMFSSLFDENL